MYGPGSAVAVSMAALLVMKRCAMSAEGRSPLGMTKQPGPVLGHGSDLSWPIADPLVFHEDRPAWPRAASSI